LRFLVTAEPPHGWFVRLFDFLKNAIVMAGQIAAEARASPEMIPRNTKSPPKVLFVPLVGTISADA
jgi:hypothetical protein